MRPAADVSGIGAKRETLPLTAFEEMFFWGDCPALPCLCYSRMRWSGVLDRRALESAAQTALERHPLLRSRMELVDDETPRWINSPETTCAIDWQIGSLRAIGIHGGGRSAVRTAYRVDDAAQLER